MGGGEFALGGKWGFNGGRRLKITVSSGNSIDLALQRFDLFSDGDNAAELGCC